MPILACGCEKGGRRVRTLNWLMKQYKGSGLKPFIWAWDIVHGRITLPSEV